jgi:predicted nucleotidyltransferase component of viral defense system
MAGAKTHIIHTPKELSSIGSLTIKQPQQNKVIVFIFYACFYMPMFKFYFVSINFAHKIVALLQVMNNIDMDVFNVPEQGTIVEPNTMFLEDTSQAFTHAKVVHLRHNKTKKANTHVIPKGTQFRSIVVIFFLLDYFYLTYI